MRTVSPRNSNHDLLNAKLISSGISINCRGYFAPILVKNRYSLGRSYFKEQVDAKSEKKKWQAVAAPDESVNSSLDINKN